MPFKKAVNAVPDQQMQDGIRYGTEQVYGNGPVKGRTQHTQHIHDKKVLADDQGIEDGHGSQTLPDTALEGEQHQCKKPDQFQDHIKKIIRIDNHVGEAGAGNISGRAPELSVPFLRKMA